MQTLGPGDSSGGWPPPRAAFDTSGHAAIGLDLGGTKMFGALADLDGTVLHERYVPWQDKAEADTVEALCGFVEELLAIPRPAGQQILGIGVGAPGVTHPDEGLVTWAPGLGWSDLPLKAILTERFDLPVYVDNDVNLSALGEHGFGAGQGAESLVCLSIGTGIGAGLIIGGRLYRGSHYSAGEIGYLVPGIEFLGRRYEQFGALESLAAGPGIAGRACRLLQEQGIALPPAGLTAEEVFKAARDGQGWAQQVVAETVDLLALAVANVSALLDPEVVVLGGGVARSADLLVEPILQRLAGVIPSIPRLVPSPLGRRAAVLGAILLVRNATKER